MLLKFTNIPASLNLYYVQLRHAYIQEKTGTTQTPTWWVYVQETVFLSYILNMLYPNCFCEHLYFKCILIHYRYDLISKLDFISFHLLPWILFHVIDFILVDWTTWHFLCMIIQILNVMVQIPSCSKTLNSWLWLVCLYSCILRFLCLMSKLPLCS